MHSGNFFIQFLSYCTFLYNLLPFRFLFFRLPRVPFPLSCESATGEKTCLKLLLFYLVFAGPVRCLLVLNFSLRKCITTVSFINTSLTPRLHAPPTPMLSSMPLPLASQHGPAKTHGENHVPSYPIGSQAPFSLPLDTDDTSLTSPCCITLLLASFARCPPLDIVAALYPASGSCFGPASRRAGRVKPRLFVRHFLPPLRRSRHGFVAARTRCDTASGSLLQATRNLMLLLPLV